MKKIVTFFVAAFLAANTMAQSESDYIFVKSGLKWVDNYEIEKGSSYTGFLDAANRPTCYGTYIDASGKRMIGQFKDGKANGIVTFKAGDAFKYFGEVKNNETEGIGRQSVLPQPYGNIQHVVSEFKAGKSADGLACTTPGSKIIKNGKPVEDGSPYYQRAIYDDNMEVVKDICAKENIRFVENTTVGDYTYSGGWKNGEPYYYGIFKALSRSFHDIAVGYIQYEESSKKLELDRTKPHEEFFENYSTIKYSKWTVNDAGDTTKIFQTKESYEYSIVGKDGKYKRKDIFHFGKIDEFVKFYKYVNGHQWGIYGKNEYLQEGYLDEADEALTVGKLITTDGEIHHFENGEHSVDFPNGDKMKIHINESKSRNVMATYTFANGDYAIGWFYPHSYGEKEFYRSIKPLYCYIYFSDGELKKKIEDDYASNYLSYYAKDKLNLFMAGKKDGKFSYTFERGDQYDGEWSNYMPNGEGVMTESGGTVYKGSFENGSFVKGVVNKSDGTVVYGARGASGSLVNDSIFYPNGNYEKYIKKDGKTIKIIRWKYSIDSKLDDYSFRLVSAKDPSSAEMQYDGNDQGEGRLTFLQTKEGWQQGDYIEGTFSVYDYGRGPFTDKTISKLRKTYSYGVYEGAKRPGEGILTLTDGTVVKANFPANMQCTSARVTYPNQDEYDGAILTGAREGQGEYRFANGDKVSTVWVKNNIGKEEATYTWKDGRKFVGVIKGEKPTKGVFYNADGTEANKKQVKEWKCELPIQAYCLPQ